MLPEEFKREFDGCRGMVEERLRLYFTEGSALSDAMSYSLLAGGKRIRPILVLQFCKASGGDMTAALPAACAVEMLHTYSLIHDDLPCMDNDDLRRGKPTNHKVFGECLAILSGDALQAEAFNTLFKSELPADTVVKMGRILARAAGLGGICLGQAMDMESEGRSLTLDELTTIHRYKTASLLIASAQMGVAAAGGSAGQLRAAEEYASHLGLAFQIQDDILDDTGTTETLGKPAGSDRKRSKTTFMSLMSHNDARHIVGDQTRYAIAALHNNFANTEFLEALAIFLEERKY
ncbi:MAG: polyprenyl synthetase family protein [Clostridiales bacterium]|jgi:geranylgeranyl diphosphate synthase type II|nr:polyprenyl synthetase family protein [Clostridiales bacterium]